MNVAGGFRENMAFPEYQALGFDNFSALKFLEKSPMAYRYHKDNPCEPTAPMILGNHAHKAILEPGLTDFAVWPASNGRRYGHKFDEWCIENAAKTQLNEKEMLFVGGMAMAVHANPVAHKYLRYGSSELTMTWRDPGLKRDMKARIDKQAEIDGEDVLVSLKTTTDCRDFAFSNQYAKMCYAAQDAIYQNGYFYLTGTLPRMVTIAVESRPPHETAVYSIPNDVIRQGQQQVSKWVELLKECERMGKWPAAVEGEVELSLPSWAMPGGDFEFDDLVPIER